jgi:hypothetical protein
MQLRRRGWLACIPHLWQPLARHAQEPHSLGVACTAAIAGTAISRRMRFTRCGMAGVGRHHAIRVAALSRRASPAFQRLIGDRRKTASAGPLAVRWPQAESTNNIQGNRVNALVRLSRPNGSQWKMMLGFEQANDKKEQIMKATTSTLLAVSALILALAGSNARWQRWAARDATAKRTIDNKECAPSSPSQCT